jgi:membrane protein YqaA with SNARE-associated domain
MSALPADHPLLALFLTSFLASTLLPLGSEWLLALLLTRGCPAAAAVAAATAGNTLGACTTWAIGRWGGPWLTRRLLRLDAAAQARAEAFYARWGVWSLLLSWLPVVGDPLCLAGGVLRVGFGRFLLLVAAGKGARYAALAAAVCGGMRLLGG